MNQIKRKLSLMSPRRLMQLLSQLQKDAAFVTSYVDPQFTEEEIADARFQANTIVQALDKDAGPRKRLLVTSLMFQASVINLNQSINYHVEERKRHGTDRSQEPVNISPGTNAAVARTTEAQIAQHQHSSKVNDGAPNPQDRGAASNAESQPQDEPRLA